MGRRLCWFSIAVALVSLVAAVNIVWTFSSGLYALLPVTYLLFVVWVVWTSVTSRKIPLIRQKS